MPRDTTTLYGLVGLFVIIFFKLSGAFCAENLSGNIEYNRNSFYSRIVGKISASPVLGEMISDPTLRKRKFQFEKEVEEVDSTKKFCGAMDEFETEFYKSEGEIDKNMEMEMKNNDQVIRVETKTETNLLDDDLEQFRPHFRNVNDRRFINHQLKSLKFTDSDSDLENYWTSQSETPLITSFTGKRLLGNANFFANNATLSPDIHNESVTCNFDDEEDYGSVLEMDILDEFMFCDLNERGEVTALHSLTDSEMKE